MVARQLTRYVAMIQPFVASDLVLKNVQLDPVHNQEIWDTWVSNTLDTWIPGNMGHLISN